MTKAKFASDYGRHHGKSDMERIGVFNEGPYLVGPYKSTPSGPDRNEGVQMITSGPKVKTGLQDCYLENTPFKSLHENDPYLSVYQLDLRFTARDAKKNLGGIFRPPGVGKTSSGPGDYYGTFSGRVDAVSAQTRTKAPHRTVLPNFTTNPGKKGSYGYADITFSKFPTYMPDDFEASKKKRLEASQENKRLRRTSNFLSTLCPQPYFDPNPYKTHITGSPYVRRGQPEKKFIGSIWYPPRVPKKPGNKHDGTFSEFPKYMSEPYIRDRSKVVSRDSAGATSVFWPPVQGCNVTKYDESVMLLNVAFRVNHKNWRFAKPFTYDFDFDQLAQQ